MRFHHGPDVKMEESPETTSTLLEDMHYYENFNHWADPMDSGDAKSYIHVNQRAVLGGLQILCLDGGGVRGYSSLLILRQLMEQINSKNPPRPCDVFDMIGGTSTGGIIAIMLGRLHMTVDECIMAYESLAGYVFGDKKLLPIDVMGRLAARYDHRDLEKAIKHYIYHTADDENARLMEQNPSCSVVAFATRGRGSKIVPLQNYHDSNYDHELHDIKIWEASRATSAAPGYFAPITIGRFKRPFFDGATGCNNPVEAVFEAATKQWFPKRPGDLKRQLNCLVSIGTGVPKSYEFDLHLASLPRILANIATETEDTARRFEKTHRELVDAGKYFRFSVTGGMAEIDLGASHKLDEIDSATMEYLANTEDHIRACANGLTIKAELCDDTKDAERDIPLLPSKSRWCRGLWPLSWYKIVFMIVAFVLLKSAMTPSRPPPLPACHPYCWLDRDAAIFAIIGKTGAGKSSFIHKLGGKHAETGEPPVVGHSLESCTETLQFYEVNVTNIETEKIYIIDTPGFDDSRYSDADILKMITLGLAELYKKGDKLMKGIIFVHDISQPRIGGIGKEMLNALQKMVGHENFQNVALVTNKWIKNPDPEEARREIERYRELQDIYWADMIEGGSHIMRYAGTRKSAHLIINNMLHQDDILLNALREMSVEEKEWEDTEAGHAANAETGLYNYFFASLEKYTARAGAATTAEQKSVMGTKENTLTPPRESKPPPAQSRVSNPTTRRPKTAATTQKRSSSADPVLKPRMPLSKKLEPKQKPREETLSHTDTDAAIGVMIIFLFSCCVVYLLMRCCAG